MKKFLLIFLLLTPLSVSADMTLNDIESCKKFVSESDHYKIAFKNEYCMRAAKTGNASAQYSVGLSYGLNGNYELEEKYYRLAAAQGSLSSYMGLGHVLTIKKDEEAVYWYKRYISALNEFLKHDSSDRYAASLITRFYKITNDPEKLQVWIKECDRLFGK